MLARSDWPPRYSEVLAERDERLRLLQSSPDMLRGAKVHYASHPAEFIDDWCWTRDPRNAGIKGKMVRMPFVLFPRQRELVEFFHACMVSKAPGLVEKSRDMGATWLGTSFSIWVWLFHSGSAVGWGSRKADLVDKLGNMDSIFEKIRAGITDLPAAFLPAGFDPQEHMSYMRIINPENGATIIGESGDNIGRGGRSTVYMKDESAHYERPDSIEAALSDNTDVQIDISSVHGTGTPFHRKREAGYDWFPGDPMHKDRTAVFVLDWRDHPEKTQEWYDARKSKNEAEGTTHLFAQEVDRNYAASVEGVIILPDWVDACVDAHLLIPEIAEGGWCAALDVADGEDGDRNAYAARKGLVLLEAEEWGARDTAVTARHAVSYSEQHPCEVNYDCIGVGAGVKAEVNNLKDNKVLPAGIKFLPWNASAAGIADPDKRVIKGDKQSPLNKDFFASRKSQGWWYLARRCEKTWRAVGLVRQGEKNPYQPDELVSFCGKMKRILQVKKELCQPSMGKTPSLKLQVDKTPDGTRSPNVGDAVMMVYHPVKSGYDGTMAWVGRR